MPLTLPGAPLLPSKPVSAAEALTGPRVTTYRFDLLGRVVTDGGAVIEEAELGTLDGVSGGEVSWESWSAIKGAGSLTLTDLPTQDIDWLTTRVRPMARITAANGSATIEVPCGVYLAAAPVEGWTALGRSWKIELMDKNALLDQDIPSDADGNPVTYALAPGTNVVEAVVALIESVGGSAALIEPSGKTLTNPMTWDMGTTKLKIVNDLLDAANFFSLRTDGWGRFLSSPYVDPEDRAPVYSAVDPFVEGPTAVVSPEWKHDQDIYAIPNRMVAVGEGSDTEPADVQVATNTDPDSPFSYPSRGRWITVVDTGVAAADSTALLGYARRRLTNLTNVYSDLAVSHLYLPDLQVDTVIRFAHAPSGIDGLFVIRKTSLEFDALALSSTEMRRVA